MSIPIIPARGATLLPNGNISFRNNLQFVLPVAVPITRNYGYSCLNSFSDFPEESGGVTTLDSTQIYRVNGEITLPDGIQVNLNGAPIVGLNNFNDKITGNVGNGGFFISSGENVSISNLTITNTGTNGKCVDLDGVGKSCVLEQNKFVDSAAFGDISDFAIVDIRGAVLSNLDDGSMIQGTAQSITIQNYFADQSNGGTLLKILDQPVEVIRIYDSLLVAAFGVTAIDIDNSGELAEIIIFDGAAFISQGGTLKTGFFETDDNVILDALAAMSFSVTFDLRTSYTINSTHVVDKIVDEDDMASDSDVALVTQQSVKAFASHDRQCIQVAAGQSTASPTLNDITGAIITTKNLGQNGSYDIKCSVELEGDVNGWAATVAILVDGVIELSRSIQRGASSKNDPAEISLVVCVFGVLAGEDIKVQWSAQAGVITLNGLDLVVDGIPDSRVVA